MKYGRVFTVLTRYKPVFTYSPTALLLQTLRKSTELI